MLSSQSGSRLFGTSALRSQLLRGSTTRLILEQNERNYNILFENIEEWVHQIYPWKQQQEYDCKKPHATLGMFRYLAVVPMSS